VHIRLGSNRARAERDGWKSRLAEFILVPRRRAKRPPLRRYAAFQLPSTESPLRCGRSRNCLASKLIWFFKDRVDAFELLRVACDWA
jgi:hypothetical protein